MAEAFDICDTKNVYRPCPNCLSTIGDSVIARVGMGLVSRRDGMAIVHFECDFSGPAKDTDKEAFDAWNLLPRTQST